MRNDAPNTAIWMRQQWRLGEISLEQFMHVLLIRTINALQMSAKRGFTPDWEGWVYAPWALALSLQHVKMTRWQVRQTARRKSGGTADGAVCRGEGRGLIAR